MDSIVRALSDAVRIAGERGTLHAEPDLQSWPGIVHGGAVVALLDVAAARLGIADGPRTIEGRLTASLPLDTALGLDAEPWEDGTTITITHGAQVVSSGTIRPLGVSPAVAERWSGGDAGDALPMSDRCLACGADNPLGLRVALRVDDVGVWARIAPGPIWRRSPTRLHPAVVPVLLDEIAWWLGASVSGQGGLTNRIDVTLLDPELPAGEPIVGAGRLADVRPIDRRRMFWRAELALMTERGRMLATASIVFRGGPEYSAQQMPYFRDRMPPALFLRLFPSHAGG